MPSFSWLTLQSTDGLVSPVPRGSTPIMSKRLFSSGNRSAPNVSKKIAIGAPRTAEVHEQRADPVLRIGRRRLGDVQDERAGVRIPVVARDLEGRARDMGGRAFSARPKFQGLLGPRGRRKGKQRPHGRARQQQP